MRGRVRAGARVRQRGVTPTKTRYHVGRAERSENASWGLTDYIDSVLGLTDCIGLLWPRRFFLVKMVHSSFDHQNTQIDAHSTPNDQKFLPDGRISVPKKKKKGRCTHRRTHVLAEADGSDLA